MTTINYTNKDLGFNQDLMQYRSKHRLDSFELGRVILEHKDRYVVLSEEGEFDCELIGNLRFTAESRADFPAVGDWLAFQEYDTGKGLIHHLYPRKNVLERQAIGSKGEKQIIASNIDVGLIVQSVNRDYSINRIERYLAICHAAKIEPIIIFNKIDLLDAGQLDEMLFEIENQIQGVTVIPMSNVTGEGIQELKPLIEAGKTYCLLGSSGVGKSTLINTLAGIPLMKTGDISSSIDRGKHVTTHREMMVLENGGIIIDNPGMREVGMTDSTSGLAMTFEQIGALAEQCKFNDCSHQNEKGCAVLAALEAGELIEETYNNYMKLQREQAHFTATVYEKRKRERAFGKMVKRIMQEKHSDKG